MSKEYVTKIEGAYSIADSRVSLDSIVYAWLSGLSPESIVENFETLSLEQVYGAITFYLAHKAEVDAHLQSQKAKFEELTRKARATHPLLYKQLEAGAEILL